MSPSSRDSRVERLTVGAGGGSFGILFWLSFGSDWTKNSKSPFVSALIEISETTLPDNNSISVTGSVVNEAENKDRSNRDSVYDGTEKGFQGQLKEETNVGCGEEEALRQLSKTASDSAAAAAAGAPQWLDRSYASPL